MAAAYPSILRRPPFTPSTKTRKRPGCGQGASLYDAVKEAATAVLEEGKAPVFRQDPETKPALMARAIQPPSRALSGSGAGIATSPKKRSPPGRNYSAQTARAYIGVRRPPEKPMKRGRGQRSAGGQSAIKTTGEPEGIPDPGRAGYRLGPSRDIGQSSHTSPAPVNGTMASPVVRFVDIRSLQSVSPPRRPAAKTGGYLFA